MPLSCADRPLTDSAFSAPCYPCRLAFFLASDTLDHGGTLLKSLLYLVGCCAACSVSSLQQHDLFSAQCSLR